MAGKIGFIGLGIMGSGMTKNLLGNGGLHLTVCNRTENKCLPLNQMGAKIASTPLEATKENDLIILMLSDNDAVELILNGEEGVLSGMGKGKTLIDMGTNTPRFNRRVKSMVEERGGKYLEAPVLGSRSPAREGTLTILVGGDEPSYEEARVITHTSPSSTPRKISARPLPRRNLTGWPLPSQPQRMPCSSSPGTWDMEMKTFPPLSKPCRGEMGMCI